MKRTLFPKAILLMWLVAFIVGCSKKATPLDEWEEKVRRPGFSLIDKTDTSEMFVALYDSGNHDLAFCFHKKSGRWGGHVIDVADGDGADAHDYSRVSSHKLSWTKGVGPFSKSGRDGIMIPIKKNYGGPLNVAFSATEPGHPSRMIYKRRIDHFPVK